MVPIGQTKELSFTQILADLLINCQHSFLVDLFVPKIKLRERERERELKMLLVHSCVRHTIQCTDRLLGQVGGGGGSCCFLSGFN